MPRNAATDVVADHVFGNPVAYSYLCDVGLTPDGDAQSAAYIGRVLRAYVLLHWPWLDAPDVDYTEIGRAFEW